jgi:putative IMPACT (imprinted ancient) family translation regulator
VLARSERIHFDASHNCSAWRIHGGPWRANDAGEPSGSAGAPILAAIDGAGLENCVVVVTRYFGGTRLGVGGLIRAYGDVASAAIAAAPAQRALPAVRLRVAYGYDQTAAVMRAIERFHATAVEHGFADSGEAADLTFTIPAGAEADLREMLRELTAGAVSPVELLRTVIHLPPDGRHSIA